MACPCCNSEAWTRGWSRWRTVLIYQPTSDTFVDMIQNPSPFKDKCFMSYVLTEVPLRMGTYSRPCIYHRALHLYLFLFLGAPRSNRKLYDIRNTNKRCERGKVHGRQLLEHFPQLSHLWNNREKSRNNRRCNVALFLIRSDPQRDWLRNNCNS